MVGFIILFIIVLLIANQLLNQIRVTSISDQTGHKATDQWRSIVNMYAYEYDIPPKIILGIIYTESRGFSGAVGCINEGGLMQLTTNALTDIDMSYIDVFNPHSNIHAGTKYLQHLFTLTGNLNSAIQSYNSGYSRVKSNPKAGLNYLNKVLKAAELFA